MMQKGVLSSGILLRWSGTGGESWRKQKKRVDNTSFFFFKKVLGRCSHIDETLQIYTHNHTKRKHKKDHTSFFIFVQLSTTF